MNGTSILLIVLFTAGSLWLISTTPEELRTGAATFRSYEASRKHDPINYWLFVGIKPVLAFGGLVLAISIAVDPL